MVKILLEEWKIIGYCCNNYGGVFDNFYNYFVVEFDKDFFVYYIWGDGWQFMLNILDSEGEYVGVIVGFVMEWGEQVNVKVVFFFISFEQVQCNFDQEIGRVIFEVIK